MTERMLTYPAPGPVTLRASSRASDIRVHVTDAPHATVAIRTEATRGPLHDAVQAAVLEYGHGTLTAKLTDDSSGGIVIASGRGSVSIGGGIANSVVSVGSGNSSVISTGSGSVVQVNGRTWVNGVEVGADSSGGGPGTAGTIQIDATLPHGSSVDLHTTSGDITATGGSLNVAIVRASSGDIEIDSAWTADLTSSSGDITLDITIGATLNSSSGDIRIGQAGTVTANSSSGDIRVDDLSGRADLSTSSGDITARYSGPEPSTHTSSGRVRLKQVAPTARDTIPSQRAEPQDAVPPEQSQKEPEDAVPPGFERTRSQTPWWRR
jgi:hypothetical protein